MMKMEALRAKPSSLIVPESVFISINLVLCDIFLGGWGGLPFFDVESTHRKRALGT